MQLGFCDSHENTIIDIKKWIGKMINGAFWITAMQVAKKSIIFKFKHSKQNRS